MANVTIIIPVYNGETFVRASIESALRQGELVNEIIVVDDGSTDGTPTVVAAMAEPRVRLIHQPNRGVAAARNLGLAQVRPDTVYVVFLDHDDLLLPGAIPLLQREMEADPRRSGVFGQAVVIDGDGKVQDAGEIYRSHRERYIRWRKHWRPNTGPIALADLLSATCAITPGQLMTRLELAREIGGFNRMCFPSDDWDLLVKLAALGTLWGVPDVVLQYRRHGSNTSKRSVRMRLAGLSLRLVWMRRLPWALKWEVARAYGCRIIDHGLLRLIRNRRNLPPSLAD
jgi:glycosyltransferase involved in cell wall biosynthesis